MSSITAAGLGKAYRRYQRSRDRLLELLPGTHGERYSLDWAVRNISFTVEAGEALGIIGMNGAGKSTLLRLLTGTTSPTEGSFSVAGKVSALLELGIGVHPDFTGWQNARLSCQLLGLSESEIREVMPWIQEFSELGDHMDQPVRTYSTGMQVRLAFSAATAVRPDVLIVDEALSVGDIFFQHRSMGRIREMRAAGTTVLFVTHDPTAVKTLCDRVLLLDRGSIVCEGKASTVYDFYNALIAAKEGSVAPIEQNEMDDGEVSTRTGGGGASIRRVELLNKDGDRSRIFPVGAAVQLSVELSRDEDCEIPTVGFLIRDRLGNEVFGTNTHHLQLESPDEGATTLQVSFATELRLGPGSYSVSVALHRGPTHLDENHDWWDRALVFQVVEDDGARFTGVAQLPAEAGWGKF